MKGMLIKELAGLLNISTRAIRFYEEKGIIQPQKHPHNQYRLFSDSDARRLQTVISLREIGIPIEEIKLILLELDKGKRDDALYALELQRAMMFAQLAELKNNIEMTDSIIGQLKANQALDWQHIFDLTKGLKKLRDVRSNWRDHWDFDVQAPLHDERVLNRVQADGDHPRYPEYAAVLQSIYDMVDPLEGEKGLDLGTGTGNLASLFLEQGVAMCGIDQSKEMLRQCRRKLPAFETKLGNLLAVPYLDSSFDFAVSSYALHHLTDEQKLLALEEIRRVLKPNGRICIADFMFADAGEKASYSSKLQEEGGNEALDPIENAYYADCSQLLNWFWRNGYKTVCKRIGDLLQVVYAEPI